MTVLYFKGHSTPSVSAKERRHSIKKEKDHSCSSSNNNNSSNSNTHEKNPTVHKERRLSLRKEKSSTLQRTSAANRNMRTTSLLDIRVIDKPEFIPVPVFRWIKNTSTCLGITRLFIYSDY